MEIVRSGIAYREKQNQPITTTEIDELNGHLKERALRSLSCGTRIFGLPWHKLQRSGPASMCGKKGQSRSSSHWMNSVHGARYNLGKSLSS